MNSLFFQYFFVKLTHDIPELSWDDILHQLQGHGVVMSKMAGFWP